AVAEVLGPAEGRLGEPAVGVAGNRCRSKLTPSRGRGTPLLACGGPQATVAAAEPTVAVLIHAAAEVVRLAGCRSRLPGGTCGGARVPLGKRDLPQTDTRTGRGYQSENHLCKLLL